MLKRRMQAAYAVAAAAIVGYHLSTRRKKPPLNLPTESSTRCNVTVKTLKANDSAARSVNRSSFSRLLDHLRPTWRVDRPTRAAVEAPRRYFAAAEGCGRDRRTRGVLERSGVGRVRHAYRYGYDTAAAPVSDAR